MKRTKAELAKEARPTSPPLRARVLNAAFSAFMENGYAGTSTLDIATRAGVSKRDVYAVCADKPTILREAVTERAKRMRLPLELPAATGRDALLATLTAFGAAILRGVCDAPVLAVYRLAIAESGRAPEVARVLDGAGREANRAALGRMLARARADGLIGAGDPAAMAVDFFALLWGDLLLRLLLRLAATPTPRALDRRARQAAEKLLRLYP